jgi:GNAT superfamily N-acetyltransferase
MHQLRTDDVVAGDDLVLSLDLAPAPVDVRRIAEGLFETVESLFATSLLRRPFSVFVRARDGALVGGLNARLAFGDLHVDQLWCAREIRGRGFGSRLLEKAEQYGREHHAAHSLLNTFDPGLIPFYEKRGYSVMGTIPGLAARRPVFFLKKEL